MKKKTGSIANSHDNITVIASIKAPVKGNIMDGKVYHSKFIYMTLHGNRWQKPQCSMLVIASGYIS